MICMYISGTAGIHWLGPVGYLETHRLNQDLTLSRSRHPDIMGSSMERISSKDIIIILCQQWIGLYNRIGTDGISECDF